MLGSSEVLKTTLTVPKHLVGGRGGVGSRAEHRCPAAPAASVTPACPPAARRKAHAELPWQVGNFQPGLN